MINKDISRTTERFSFWTKLHICVLFAVFALGTLLSLLFEIYTAGFVLITFSCVTVLTAQILLIYRVSGLWKGDEMQAPLDLTDFSLAPLFDAIYHNSLWMLSVFVICQVSTLPLVLSSADFNSYLKKLPFFILAALIFTLVLRVVVGLVFKNTVFLQNTPHPSSYVASRAKLQAQTAVLLTIVLLLTGAVQILLNHLVIKPPFESLEPAQFAIFLEEYNSRFENPAKNTADFSDITSVDVGNHRVYRKADLISAAERRKTNNEFFVYFYLFELVFLLSKHQSEMKKLKKDYLH